MVGSGAAQAEEMNSEGTPGPKSHTHIHSTRTSEYCAGATMPFSFAGGTGVAVFAPQSELTSIQVNRIRDVNVNLPGSSAR